jgi:hypothetical protein
MPDQVTDDRRPDDAPSALDRLQTDPHSRAKFLRMAGVGAAGALSVALAACGSDSKTTSTATMAAARTTSGGTSDKQDLEIVQYALTLEHLEAGFYKTVAASGLFKGSDLDEIKKLQATEEAHVGALTGVVSKLGGTPVAAPKAKFPLNDAKSVLALAATVENLGAAAYLGQAPRIHSPEILAAALSIHSVEARHASALNKAIGKPVTPDGAFGKPATMATVLAAVKPFLVA